MAIDTERKRASAFSFNSHDPCIIPHAGPIDQFDMMTLMGCYGGIPVQAPQVRGQWRLNPAGTDNWTLNPEGTSVWREGPASPDYWNDDE